MKKSYANLMLFGTALFWGIAFVVAKLAQDSFTTAVMLSTRMIIASALFLIYNAKRLKNINKTVVRGGIVTGVLLAFVLLFQMYGLKVTTSSKAALITGLNIIFVPFIYWMTSKRKPHTSSYIAIALASVGMFFLTVDFKTSFALSLGDGLVLVCSVCAAAHVVAISHYAQKCDTSLLAMAQIVVCTIITTGVAIFKDGYALPPIGPAYLHILYLAIPSTFGGFLMQSVAQEYTSPTSASLILCTEAMIGSLLAVFILKETMTGWMIFGCAVMFSGILAENLAAARREKR